VNVENSGVESVTMLRSLTKMMSKRVIIISLFVLLVLIIPVNATKITINPTVDAVVVRNGTAYPFDNWSAITAGDGTEVVDGVGVEFAIVGLDAANWNDANENTYQLNRRYVASFNFTTSNIPADATITSVVFGNKGTVTGTINPDWGIVDGTLTSTTSAPVKEDYQKIGNTELAPRILYANWTNSDWNNYTFNTDGLTYATQSKGGYLVLFFTSSWDIDRTDGARTNWSLGRVTLNQVEKNETLNDPFIEVTYSQPVPLPAPTVTGITPSTGQNTTIISITNLAGTNFVNGATVNLTMSGQANITSGAVTVVDPTNITTTFDLTGAKVGAWNVNVTNPDGQEGSLVDGFTVTNVTPPAPDKVGVFRGLGYWYLDMNNNGTWDPTSDTEFFWGKQPGDTPITGDWNHDGITETGIFRSGGTWYLDMNNNGTWDGSPPDTEFFWGKQPGDIPVTGDWTGDGTTETGIFRPGTGFYLDMNNNGTWDNTPTDTMLAWSGLGLQPNDIPATGDWNGDGITETGIFRNGDWYLDINNNGHWDPGTDVIYPIGQPGDKPVTGKW